MLYQDLAREEFRNLAFGTKCTRAKVWVVNRSYDYWKYI